ncbi:type II secretion system protein [Acetivibrio straminisolvens]|uniref:Type IV pilin PilA n=1 Tax=Acetivibrio straminisolvens JCM 21531 TaxID=1294263 RepID=W4V3K2_9FIRM|nr:type II secretion system protein [Acetivibrio straminisolvens]GAE88020.1 type IV pilin PilA [Acetivibrio straminisolvens JCM 21531]
MKKMLKNQKGFSLVELLIVIAIMGVLAAVAFSMFAGVLSNSKRRADERTADQIAKALTAYMVDSGDSELKAFSSKDSKIIITELQKEIKYTPTGSTTEKSYGPYLTPKEGSDASYDNFAPQYDKHKGYSITYYPRLLKADVEAVEDTPTVASGESSGESSGE